jgi:hypothetical protein
MTWTVAGYVVEELLGYGGFGEVWRGQARATGAPVALKRLPVDDAGQVHAARAEAALLSMLDHPHLIRLHELVAVDAGVVLVLDLAGGGSLADLLARRGRLTPGEVVTALAPIGAALAYAHNEGVVHGDVTPANVLFSENGLPLLGDLGVARIIGDTAPARSTPAYVDPSVAAGHAPGAASDVFMLAAVAVHALTGQPVWTGVTPEDTVARAAAGDLGDLLDRLAQLPPELAALLERALRIEPHLRCSAAEFALDLRHSSEPAPVELAAGRPHHVEPPPGPRPEDGPAPAAAADVARPSFSRPGYDGPSGNPAQLTHGVRAALHAPVPRRSSRLRELVRHRGTRVAGLVIAVIVVIAVGAGLLQWTTGGSDHGGAHRSGGSHRPAGPPPAIPAAPTSPPAAASPAASTSSPAGAAALLQSLDRIREQAFARREVSLLARVYVAGPLLDQDTALLRRVVPAGCGLVGVHTTYAAVTVSPASQRLVLSTTATLAPSRLSCHRTTSAGAAGERPTRLRIELVRRSDGYRIASQQKMR